MHNSNSNEVFNNNSMNKDDTNENELRISNIYHINIIELVGLHSYSFLENINVLNKLYVVDIEILRIGSNFSIGISEEYLSGKFYDVLVGFGFGLYGIDSKLNINSINCKNENSLLKKGENKLKKGDNIRFEMKLISLNNSYNHDEDKQITNENINPFNHNHFLSLNIRCFVNKILYNEEFIPLNYDLKLQTQMTTFNEYEYIILDNINLFFCISSCELGCSSGITTLKFTSNFKYKL